MSLRAVILPEARFRQLIQSADHPLITASSFVDPLQPLLERLESEMAQLLKESTLNYEEKLARYLELAQRYKQLQLNAVGAGAGGPSTSVVENIVNVAPSIPPLDITQRDERADRSSAVAGDAEAVDETTVHKEEEGEEHVEESSTAASNFSQQHDFSIKYMESMIKKRNAGAVLHLERLVQLIYI